MRYKIPANKTKAEVLVCSFNARYQQWYKRSNVCCISVREGLKLAWKMLQCLLNLDDRKNIFLLKQTQLHHLSWHTNHWSEYCPSFWLWWSIPCVYAYMITIATTIVKPAHWQLQPVLVSVWNLDTSKAFEKCWRCEDNRLWLQHKR